MGGGRERQREREGGTEGGRELTMTDGTNRAPGENGPFSLPPPPPPPPLDPSPSARGVPPLLLSKPLLLATPGTIFGTIPCEAFLLAPDPAVADSEGPVGESAAVPAARGLELSALPAESLNEN